MALMFQFLGESFFTCKLEVSPTRKPSDADSVSVIRVLRYTSSYDQTSIDSTIHIFNRPRTQTFKGPNTRVFNLCNYVSNLSTKLYICTYNHPFTHLTVHIPNHLSIHLSTYPPIPPTYQKHTQPHPPLLQGPLNHRHTTPQPRNPSVSRI